ncbi:SNAP receptor PEP12 [Ascoidea rubescens DSM 1968]|uniref:Snare-domain-containing protein n=1 Tax=Ascoidea rubescens DSM 1968 TaxID=1344418 RepID=A0A1D2VKZ4_9ASCO|nr:snare-domain-containing protein [Ascoidea rubescens DSM 1968]ODV62268.1 snare-domain-containing protein [Ascoidea rubescens DSM 1968]
MKSTLEETPSSQISVLEGENNNDHNNLDQNDQIIVEVDPINRHEFIHQQNLIIERENEIQTIESGITELNEIFNDLSNIIQEQGIVLDNIEANLYTYSDNVQDAHRELRKASYYQKRSRGKQFCFLVVLMVILFLILVAMVLG